MNKTLKKLEDLANNEKSSGSFKDYNLSSIRSLLKIYGNPHKHFRTIHITGTNGKGSVAHMLNSILILSGLKTGLYTSPHLTRINERVKINNKDIPTSKIIKYAEELFDILDNNSRIMPTYFDALTLFAFRYFSEEKADIAVIEVGLGGRLDSTNVISPEISIITDISMDHKHILGNTLKEITAEKAGIIKKRSIVVTSNRKKEVLDVISAKAKEEASRLYVLNRDFFAKNIRHIKCESKNEHTTGYEFSIQIKEDTVRRITESPQTHNIIKYIELKIPGDFQIINSSLVAASCILLAKSGIRISEKNIIKGLRNVIIPGRMQVLSEKPLIIFDPGHNPDALEATIKAVKEKYPGKKYIAIVSFMTDKDYLSMFGIIRRLLTKKIYYFALNDKRCFKIPKNGSKQNSAFKGVRAADNIEDLQEMLSGSITPDTLLIFTGTFRIYDIAKKLAKSMRNILAF